MECNKIENFFKGNECCGNALPEELKKHLADCNDCRSFYRFVSVLDAQKGSLEKAPEELLPAIEKAILHSNPYNKKAPFTLFKPMLRPSFAGFCVLLIAVISYLYVANSNIGYVENLSDRFKRAEFQNIRSGDVLYSGDNTIAAIRLKNNNELQIHHNTIVRIKGPRRLSLSRGEISLQSGDNVLQIETPDGVLRARNADIKISTVATLEKGILKTETTCAVYKGRITIGYPAKEIVLRQGQKTVVAENGRITYQRELTVADSEIEKNTTVRQKLLSAVESLCDCIHAENYTPGQKTNHVQLFGKEVNENKFKVRVFWPEKGLNGLVVGPHRMSFARI